MVSVWASFTAVNEKLDVPLLPLAACLTYPAPPETVPAYTPAHIGMVAV